MPSLSCLEQKFNNGKDLYFMTTESLSGQIVNNIHTLCGERKVNISTLENKLGLSTGLISRWRHNDTMPSLENIIKIADFFDVSLDEIVRVSSFPFKGNKIFWNPDRILAVLLTKSINAEIKWNLIPIPTFTASENKSSKNTGKDMPFFYLCSTDQGLFVLTSNGNPRQLRLNLILPASSYPVSICKEDWKLEPLYAFVRKETPANTPLTEEELKKFTVSFL